MSCIYLHPCMPSNPCRYLDESKSMRLQPTHILSKSLHHQVSTQWWLKTRKHETLQTYPLTNSILSFIIVILDTQVLFLARLTHVGRWTSTTSAAPNSWWSTSTWAPYTSSTTWPSSSPPPKVHSVLEKLNPKTWVRETQQDESTSKCLN